MTSIESISPSVESMQGGSVAQAVAHNTAVPTTAHSSTTSSTGATISGVAPQLAALQTASVAQETTPSSAEAFRMLGKVVEALVSVVQAFVGFMTAFMTKTTGSSGQGAAPSASNSANGVGADTTNGTGASSAPAQAGSATGSMFDVTKSDAGMINVRTRDGFLIRAEGRDQAWTITGPDGKTTRIWGDPHVYESDGNKWDFLTRSTFAFGNNKATVEVVPAGNGQTLSARVTIYSGDERVTIDGIDKDKPVITAVSRDGRQHDDALADGITFDRGLNTRGESWRSNLTGKIM